MSWSSRCPGLRLNRSPDGRVALYQPLTLLWAIGSAHQDLARLAGWDETKTLLGDFLERHGEQAAALSGDSALSCGLWELSGSWPAPPAHDSTQVRWFTPNQPASGLRASFYRLVRYSGEARVAAVEALVDMYLQDADCDAILKDAGLADADVADDEVPDDEVLIPASPLEEQYRRLCEIAARLNGSGTRFGRARQAVDILRLGSARRAVLARRGDTARTRTAQVNQTNSPMPAARSWKSITSRTWRKAGWTSWAR